MAERHLAQSIQLQRDCLCECQPWLDALTELRALQGTTAWKFVPGEPPEPMHGWATKEAEQAAAWYEQVIVTIQQRYAKKLQALQEPFGRTGQEG